MESRSNGYFKQLAFSWPAVFEKRQHDFYVSEDLRYVEIFLPGPAHTAESLIDQFVHIQCQHDVLRYMYRKSELADFLELADINILRREGAPPALSAMVLIDDRNDGNVTRDARAGNFRPPLGPLTARAFYEQMMKAVG